jgi:hypothetical protein
MRHPLPPVLWRFWLDPYAVLGVGPEASQDTLSAAHERLSNERGHGLRAWLQGRTPATLAWAHALLSDPLHRAEHDRRRALMADCRLIPPC